MYLSSVDEPRRHLLSEDPHLTQQVVQVLGLGPAERVLQARPPLPLQVLRYGVRTSPNLPSTHGLVDRTVVGSSGFSMRK